MDELSDTWDYRTKCCSGVGDTDKPKYMLVGMCGGRLGCIQTGVPFTKDGSGRLLIRVLKELGYTQSYERDEKPVYNNIYVTNLVKGVILENGGNNRIPTDMEIEFWKEDFLAEFGKVNAQKIVAIGHLVESHLEKMIDFFHHCEFCEDNSKGSRLLFLKHPSYYLRHGALGKSKPAWTEMLAEYKDILGVNIG